MHDVLGYAVLLEPQPEGGFTVDVPELPEVVTEGDTEERALAMARDAIELILVHRRKVEDGPPGQQAHAKRVADRG